MNKKWIIKVVKINIFNYFNHNFYKISNNKKKLFFAVKLELDNFQEMENIKDIIERW
jgi:hypothetical protein